MASLLSLDSPVGRLPGQNSMASGSPSGAGLTSTRPKA